MAKAVAFGEILEDSFESYAKQVILNARVLSENLIKKGYKIVSGGTSNHLMLVNLTNKNISGKKAEIALEKAGITVNKNMVPFDTKSPFVTSGIRIGTPAATTRGMKENEMEKIADLIDSAISNFENESKLADIKSNVKALCADFPLYSDLRNH
jgi:glycine hydroxymethyltransferase